MRGCGILTISMVIGLSPAWAGADQIKTLFHDMLESGAVPDQQRFFSEINESTIIPLSVQDVNELLPLARQALHSPKIEIRQYAMVFLTSVGLRSDSATLLEPCVDELGALANGAGGAQSLRHGALFALGNTHPTIIPKAVPYLLGNLENEANSSSETLTIAVSLLAALPTDRAINQRIATLVTQRANAVLTSGVLDELGLVKTNDPKALALIASSLSSTDANVRFSAVQAVTRFDRDARTQFAAQLGRIAADPKESQQLRSMANAALK
jgi:HEAT repeat protein